MDWRNSLESLMACESADVAIGIFETTVLTSQEAQSRLREFLLPIAIPRFPNAHSLCRFGLAAVRITL